MVCMQLLVFDCNVLRTTVCRLIIRQDESTLICLQSVLAFPNGSSPAGTSGVLSALFEELCELDKELLLAKLTLLIYLKMN